MFRRWRGRSGRLLRLLFRGRSGRGGLRLMLDGMRCLYSCQTIKLRYSLDQRRDLHGNQNSLKFCLCKEEMNRTISSADFRHSVWKYRRASGFSVSALLTSCAIFRKHVLLFTGLGTYIQLHPTNKHLQRKKSELQATRPCYSFLSITGGRS